MILKFIKATAFQQPIQFKFASAAASAIDYYSLLGVDKGATKAEIQDAFRRLTRTVTPDNNASLFSRLNEAFVILSDGKARDAYDSLVKTSRKITPSNLQKPKSPTVHSYIAERKAERQKQGSKEINVDKFGRYRGGVPRRNTNLRGRSLGETGTLFHNRDKIDVDPYPDHSQVDTARAQSFKNFHQDERIHRTAKPTWMSMEVNYNYFNPIRLLHTTSWKFWRLVALVFLVFPAFASYQLGLFKRIHKKFAVMKKQIKEQNRIKELEKKQKEARQKAEKERLQQQKLAAQSATTSESK